MIYFVQGESTGLIKIGLATDPLHRIRSLQAASPDKLIMLKIITGDKKTEFELHRRFQADRKHGEWFCPSHRLISFIESLEDIRDYKVPTQVKKPSLKEALEIGEAYQNLSGETRWWIHFHKHVKKSKK